MKPKLKLNMVFLFRGQMLLKNQTDVRCMVARIYRGSVMGIQSDFIPWTDIALMQLRGFEIQGPA